MGGPLRILIVEDVPSDAELAERELARGGIECVSRRVETRESFLAALADWAPDVILSDYSLPGFDGITALGLAREVAPLLPFILVTGSLNEETAVECMKAGADDYVLKDRMARLVPSVLAALDRRRAQREKDEVEKALLANEARYRTLFAAGSDAVFLLDQDSGRILEANAAAQRLYGYTLDEFLRLRSVDLSGEPDKTSQALQQRLEFAPIRYHRTKDGRKLPVEISASYFAHEGRRFSMVSVRDIGQRLAAERALRESEELLRSVIETTPDGIVLADAEGVVIGWNLGAQRMFGYRAADVIGKPVTLLMPALFRRAHQDGLVRVTETGEQHAIGRTLEMRGLRQDGREFPLEISLGTWEVGSGRAYSAIVRDVSERVLADEALRRTATAVEQAAEAILITDRAGTIRYVNPAFERTSGYARNEAVGQNPRILKSGRHDQAFYAELWETILAGKTWTGHMVNRRKDGSLYEEEATISPVLDDRGAIVNFVALKRDVTREVALQEQLNHAQRMEAIGRLAGGVAHDFNNLLQAMLSHLQLLRSASAIGSPGRTSLDEMEQQVRRGAALTRQLLLFSRNEAPRPRRLDLNQAVRHISGLLRRLVKENVEFVFGLADTPVEVVVDGGQLDQVLMNLAVNASDAMPEGGRLEIRTGIGGDNAWLSVTDTGHGIPGEIQGAIFEPFFTTKGAGKGTGLGLSVVHGIVTSHGGDVTVKSAPGAGAAFTVILPRAGADGTVSAEDEAAAVPGELSGSGELILVVEDEAAARTALAEILTASGYRVVAVGSGEEARRLPSEPAVDLVLSDLMLPGIGGPELAAALREQWPGLRVVFMSGYTDDDELRRTLGFGKVHFLQKPFDMDTLARELRVALSEGG